MIIPQKTNLANTWERNIMQATLMATLTSIVGSGNWWAINATTAGSSSSTTPTGPSN